MKPFILSNTSKRKVLTLTMYPNCFEWHPHTICILGAWKQLFHLPLKTADALFPAAVQLKGASVSSQDAESSTHTSLPSSSRKCPPLVFLGSRVEEVGKPRLGSAPPAPGRGLHLADMCSVLSACFVQSRDSRSLLNLWCRGWRLFCLSRPSAKLGSRVACWGDFAPFLLEAPAPVLVLAEAQRSLPVEAKGISPPSRDKYESALYSWCGMNGSFSTTSFVAAAVFG